MAIATDGSAVLGLGNLGPLAALPVMEGKALIFKHFGGLNAYPICLDTATPEALVDAVAAVAPGFGGINLEDIAAPACFWVEAELQSRLDIPVFHDDQHGTAAVVLAAVLNGCRMTGRSSLGRPGRAGRCRRRRYRRGGGPARRGRRRPRRLRRRWSGQRRSRRPRAPRSAGGPLQPSGGKDASSGAGRGRPVHRYLPQGCGGAVDAGGYGPRPLVFALANPEPEVFSEEMAEGAVVATGRSDFPNQINNSLCFPGFFKGALAARAAYVTPAMKAAATRAIAGCVSDEELALGVIVPSMFQARVHEQVASAVAAAWEGEHPGNPSPVPQSLAAGQTTVAAARTAAGYGRLSTAEFGHPSAVVSPTLEA